GGAVDAVIGAVLHVHERQADVLGGVEADARAGGLLNGAAGRRRAVAGDGQTAEDAGGVEDDAIDRTGDRGAGGNAAEVEVRRADGGVDHAERGGGGGEDGAARSGRGDRSAAAGVEA